jgi:hypothetical protein
MKGDTDRNMLTRLCLAELKFHYVYVSYIYPFGDIAGRLFSLLKGLTPHSGGC